MKSIKILGLAALAALMAMAFIGSSSAMAENTALCKEDTALFSGTTYLTTDACPTGKLFHHVHEATLTGAPGLLLSSIVEILCDVLFLGDVTSTNDLGNPLKILGNFSYANCMTSGGTNCTVAETSTHSVLNVLRLGHELADITAETTVGGGLAEVNAHCGFLINCTYNGEGLVGHGLGPLLSGTETNGQTRVEEQITHHVSGICPETAKLDLLTTPLEPVYISS